MKQFLDKINTLDARYVYLLIAGTILLFATADFCLIMRPQVSILMALDKKIAQSKADITTLQTNKQRLGQFQKQLDLARESMQDFNIMIHKKDEVPVVLKAISTFANEYGVKIDQLVPQPPEQKPLVQNENGKYFSQVIFVRANTGYHQLGRFLQRLEKERIFWQMDSFAISADDQNPQMHKVKMQMKILLLEK